MLRRIIFFAIHQPLFVFLLLALFVGAGIFAFRTLPIEAFPDVTDIQVTVVTLYPGHAAEEVEKQVTIPVEIAVSGLPHSVRVFSHTQFGRNAARSEQYFRFVVVVAGFRIAGVSQQHDAGLRGGESIGRALRLALGFVGRRRIGFQTCAATGLERLDNVYGFDGHRIVSRDWVVSILTCAR